MATAYHFTDDLKLPDANDRHKWINEGIKVANLEGANNQWPAAVEAIGNGDKSQVEAQLAPWKASIEDAANTLADVRPQLGKVFELLKLALRIRQPFTRSLSFKGLLRQVTGKRYHKV